MRTPLNIDVAGAKVMTSGAFILLDTNFGLQVKFDGVHHLEITIPGEYFNKVQWALLEIYKNIGEWKALLNMTFFFFYQVCGMCGNYNSNSSDDNLMPNKKPAKDVIELGNSWKSDGDSDPG